MMESTQVLELTQTLEGSQTVETSDVTLKVGCLKINGQDFYVWNKENTIGRDDSCDIVINNKAVSVEHAIIEADAFGKHLIWDLGSTNKTRLGEVQLKPRVRHYLSDGARLRFANVNATYHHIKVIPPQRLPPPEPVAQRIPGTPERVEEDAAAIASIIAETPSKYENDGSSDGDFFGEQDSSALFMRPLKLTDDAAPPPSENLVGTSTSNADPLIRLANPISANNPIGQVNESSVCEADVLNSEADNMLNSEADESDVILGSQPIFSPAKAPNIYEVDTVPVCVEETPVKALKNDAVDWDDIDDTINQISQEMDTIDTLVEKKELFVKFTPPKRADPSIDEKDDFSSTLDPTPTCKPTANRNLDSQFEELSSSNMREVLSSNPSIKQVNIYDVETEPLHVVESKVGCNDDIFDLATQNSRSEERVFDTSVYDLETQQFFAPDTKIESAEPAQGEGGTISAYNADISLCDLPTQAAENGPDGSKVPSLLQASSKKAVAEMAVPEPQNIEKPINKSFCDMLTQAAHGTVVSARVSETPVKTIEADRSCISISDLATQPCNMGSKLPPQDFARDEATTGSSNVTDKPAKMLKSDSQILDMSISEMATQQNGIGFPGINPSHHINISDVNQPTKMDSSVVDVQQQPTPPTDVSVADVQTQKADEPFINNLAGTATNVSISDLQTQVVEPAEKPRAGQLLIGDISISDFQTQLAGTPQKSKPEEVTCADLSLSDLPTQAGSNLSCKGSAAVVGSGAEDIYDALTQIPIAEHQIMCEESNTEKIEHELDSYEKELLDPALGTSDGSSVNLTGDSIAPFKTPLSESKASPGISPSTPVNDDVYLLDTQPSRLPPPDASEDAECAGSKIEVFKNTDPENKLDSVTQDSHSKPAAMSVYDLETQDIGNIKETAKPVDVYDLETQEVGKPETTSKTADVSVFDIETEEINYAGTISVVKTDSHTKTEISKEEISKEVDVPEEPAASACDQQSVRQHSQDLDINSVEYRLRAMNDTNVNSPDVPKTSLSTKSTVAELLETLEGTPRYPVQKGPSSTDQGFSQNSDAACSQFPAKRSLKKAKVLVFSDSEESTDSPVVVGKESSEPVGTSGDDPSQNSNAKCSQFPIEKAPKKVKALTYSDSEDSCETPLLGKKKVKPLEGTDEESAINSLKDGGKTVVSASHGMSCNGNPTISQEDEDGAKEPRFSKTESRTVSDGLCDKRTTSANDTGESASFRLQLTDPSMTAVESPVSERSSLPVNTKDEGFPSKYILNLESESNAEGETTPGSIPVLIPETVSSGKARAPLNKESEGNPKNPNSVVNSEVNMSLTAVLVSKSRNSNDESHATKTGAMGSDRHSCATTMSEHTPPKSTHQNTKDVPSLPLMENESSSQEKTSSTMLDNGDVPVDLFGTPILPAGPPLRKYTPRKSPKPIKITPPSLTLNVIDWPSDGKTPSRKPGNEQETPDIPKDFFGTPVNRDRPPMRQYVNKKKLSLNASSLSRGPNASSTPRSDKDSHSIVDMEETLLTTIPKADRAGKKTLDHRENSQSDTPKNVKKFRKSPVKKPAQELFSQESETFSSQDEFTDSQELGRGKRKRRKKNFFGFEDDEESARTRLISPKPCSSSVGINNVATSSKALEDSAAQPALDVSPVLPDSVEADSPRRERPRKQAFMSCESDEARQTLERYKNDACYVKSPKSSESPFQRLVTTAEVHHASVEPDRLTPEKMDLTRMRNTLKASLARGLPLLETNQKNTEVKTPAKRETAVSRLPGDTLTPEEGSLAGKLSFKPNDAESLLQSVELDGSSRSVSLKEERSRTQKTRCVTPTPSGDSVPVIQKDVGDAEAAKSRGRPGRRKRKVEVHTETVSGSNSQEVGMEPSASSQCLAQPGETHLGESGSVDDRITSSSTSRMSKKVPEPQVMPSGSHHRRNCDQASANCEVVPSSVAGPDDSGQSLVRRGKGRGKRRELWSSQETQPEMSQESQSSVHSTKGTRSRAPKMAVNSQAVENIADSAPLKRPRRKLSTSCSNASIAEVFGEDNTQQTGDKERSLNTLPGKPLARLPTQSVSLVECTTDHPGELCHTSEAHQELSITEQVPVHGKRDELSLENQPDPSRSKRGARKRGNMNTAISVKTDLESAAPQKKVKVDITESSTKNDSVGATEISKGVSKRPGRRGANNESNEDRMSDSQGGSRSSSVTSVTGRRGYRRNAKTPHILEDSDAEIQAALEVSAPGASSITKTRGRPKQSATASVLDGSCAESHHPDEVSSSEAPSVTKTRGRPKKGLKYTDPDSQVASEETAVETSSTLKRRGRPKKIAGGESVEDGNAQAPAVTEVETDVPCVTKRRGRPKKAVVAPVGEEQSLPDAEKTPEVPCASKARGRRPKKVEEPSDDFSSQDMSQGRRSGRARKKKESFDELVSRKEEEIRLRKLQQQSPSPDKASRSSLVTPSASVASVNDESAFSVPPSPASSVTSKMSASRLGASTSESLQSSSKKRKKEDLPSTPLSGQVKVMFTGLADNKLAAMVKKMGGKVTEKPTDSTVLVTDKVKRTVKFLCALGLGLPIVSPNWISKSKAFCQFADPNESLLKDCEGELKFEFELADSLEKARSRKLLQGYCIYSTASVLPPPKEMKPIIECSGGTFLPKPPARWPPQSVVISDSKDESEWPKLTKHGVMPPILSVEAILTGILQQRFDLDKYRLN